MSSTAPFAIEGIDHVLLLVTGMEQALAFYQDVLGCRIVHTMPQYAMVQLQAGTALIDLVDIAVSEGAWTKPQPEGGRNMDHLCLAVTRHDPVDLRRHLARHYIEIVEEGVHDGARGSSLSIYVRDPSGNTIEIKGPPD
jgi:catechol 2,3-dioxygenase-like lactoylglutathione lyase family enzyme